MITESYHKRILLTFLILMGSFIGFTDSNPIDIEKKVPVTDRSRSPLRLRNELTESEVFKPVDNIFSSFLRRWEIAGASVAVAKDGKLIFARGFGEADREYEVEVQPFHQFRIASISKLVTAVAIMELVEEGTISLDQKVFGQDGILNDSVYLNPRDRRVFDITVRHLLTHAGGWTRRWGDHMFIPHAIADFMNVPLPPDTETIVQFALAKKLHYTPGNFTSYSNLGYSILGLVIEKVTNQPYEVYIKRNILDPLGIFEMQLGKNLVSDRSLLEVKYYEPHGSKPVKSIYDPEEMVQRCYGGNDVEALGAAGSWIASAPDLLKLALAIDGDGKRPDILSAENVKIMTDPSYGYAPIGWKNALSDGTWWRTGSFAGTSAMIKHQNNGFTWVVLLNSSTWKSSQFPVEINRTMRKVLNSIPEWPDQDLFDLNLPVPIHPIDLKGL